MTTEERLKDVLSEGLAYAPVDPGAIVRAGRRRRRRRRFMTSAAAIMTVVGLSGVGWAVVDGSADTASVSGVEPAAGGDERPAAVVRYDKELNAWVSCLNENGIPITTRLGGSAESVYADLGRYKGKLAFGQAARACSSLLPMVTTELEAAWGQAYDPLAPERAAALDDYAECMHNNGADAFPTPNSAGAFDVADWMTWIQALDAAGSNEERALKACGPLSLSQVGGD